MTHFPHGGGAQFPPRLPPPPEDRDGWRQDDGQRRRIISPFRFFLLLVLLAIAATITALFLTSSGSNDELDYALLSPQDGASYTPGTVVVRFRIGANGSPTWEIAYRGPSTDGWELIHRGSNGAEPSLARGGLHQLELTEPGAYEVRLTVNRGGEEFIESTEFTVEPES